MGEGMQLTVENVTSVLHQGSSQLHDEKALLKKRTTIGAIQVLFFLEFFLKIYLKLLES